jgi:hypothetical protein
MPKKPPTTSKKTLAPPTGVRLRNIQIRLTPLEADRVETHIRAVGLESPVEVKPGAYAKAALLAYPQHRKLVDELQKLRDRFADEPSAAPIAMGTIVQVLGKLLEAR